MRVADILQTSRGEGLRQKPNLILIFSISNHFKSLCGLNVEPDISVSIQGSALGSYPNFWNPDNISDGVHKHVIVTRGSATTSRALCFQANR